MEAKSPFCLTSWQQWNCEATRVEWHLKLCTALVGVKKILKYMHFRDSLKFRS